MTRSLPISTRSQDERHYSFGGHRIPSVPTDHITVEADTTHLRQTDDLLSLVDLDAGWHSRDPDHLVPRPYRPVRSTLWRRRAAGLTDRVCRSAQTGRCGA